MHIRIEVSYDKILIALELAKNISKFISTLYTHVNKKNST